MNGEKLMQSLISNEQARGNIPLQLQMSLPLPIEGNKGAVRCWYYRVSNTPSGVQVYTPARCVIWDVREMRIREMNTLTAEVAGEGSDILTRDHREAEDAYLKKLGAWMSSDDAAMTEIREHFLAAAPRALRAWYEKII